MKAFIGIILLYHFNAHWGWWLALGLITIGEIINGVINYYSNKFIPVEEPNLKDIVKLDGTPYTYEDLQNIWNNGYENGYNNSQMSKH